jgi:hypothetical protein
VFVAEKIQCNSLIAYCLVVDCSVCKAKLHSPLKLASTGDLLALFSFVFIENTVVILGIHDEDAPGSVASCDKNLLCIDRMHTPEIDKHTTFDTASEIVSSQFHVSGNVTSINSSVYTLTNCGQPTSTDGIKRGIAVDNEYSDASQQGISEFTQVEDLGQYSLVSQPPVVYRNEKLHASKSLSPMFGRQNSPSSTNSDAAVEDCCVQLFKNHESAFTTVKQINMSPAEACMSLRIHDDPAAVHENENDELLIPCGVITASTESAECVHTISAPVVASLPKVVPVVYVNSNGKPTGFELIQPVPSPSYFSKSVAVEDTAGRC